MAFTKEEERLKTEMEADLDLHEDEEHDEKARQRRRSAQIEQIEAEATKRRQPIGTLKRDVVLEHLLPTEVRFEYDGQWFEFLFTPVVEGLKMQQDVVPFDWAAEQVKKYPRGWKLVCQWKARKVISRTAPTTTERPGTVLPMDNFDGIEPEQTEDLVDPDSPEEEPTHKEIIQERVRTARKLKENPNAPKPEDIDYEAFKLSEIARLGPRHPSNRDELIRRRFLARVKAAAPKPVKTNGKAKKSTTNEEATEDVL